MAYTTINKSKDHFTTQLWTGNGTTNRSLTGFGFQPDFVWIKNRDTATRYHVLMNSIRGATKRLFSNESSPEQTGTENLISFDSDGITIGNDNNVNKNGSPHVAWNWKAGGSSSANTDGSINSTVSVNTTAGFSIVNYTGTGSNATIGHGLGAVPKMFIARNITDTEQWTTYHVGVDVTAPEDFHLRLNTGDGRTNEASVWNDTAPTSSVFSVGSSGAPNGSGDNHIAYCFAEKTGYSKFGSFTGNGSTEGVFVYLGFRPALIWMKRSDSAGNWRIFDEKREGYNVDNDPLLANTSDAEGTDDNIDFLSNGFKMRTSDAALNGNGGTYTYSAFASAPLVGTNNIPATAR